MFCPQCGCEYLAGVTQCADCQVALTETLPEDFGKEKGGRWFLEGIDPADCQEILVLNNPGLLTVLKSVLDSEGIAYFLHGEHYGTYFMMNSVRLLVPSKDADRVRQILEEVTAEEMDDAGHAAPA
ncbi:MAG TPA: DUF2007 domain-containing protein [Acidobacteriota bacterium]|nr:DUF2007 domain-containing protein [Acidobacteriota bacterium]